MAGRTPDIHSSVFGPEHRRRHKSTNVTQGRKIIMEHDPQVETESELVIESLVEEVSIDGMCGVY